MLSTPILYKHLMQWFAAEVAAIPNAIFVPLGPKVTEAVNAVAQQLRLNPRQVLSGLAQLSTFARFSGILNYRHAIHFSNQQSRQTGCRKNRPGKAAETLRHRRRFARHHRRA